VIAPEQELDVSYGARMIHIKTSFYRNPHARYLVGQEFSDYLMRVSDFIPKPESTPVNAVHYLKYLQKQRKKRRKSRGFIS
jgi:hypothetical protein